MLFCNDSISYFLVDCRNNNFCWKGWSKWWEPLTSFNIREENHIHESILFGFPRKSDDAIIITYCILYAKYYIYVKNVNITIIKIIVLM